MYYCDGCHRYFRSRYALDMPHRRDSPNHMCCGSNFPTLGHIQQHWSQSLNHAYCRRCDEHFVNNDKLENHYESNHHFCKSCRKIFDNSDRLTEHYRQSGRHHYCSPCDMHFKDANRLRQHLESTIHRPRNTHCPAGCGSSFTSNTRLVLHLESGACSSGVNRNAVNRVVRQLDTKHIITDPSRLITGGTSADDEVTCHATAASWNGSAFECYLCHKLYPSLGGLDQHLASPTHQKKLYICPGPGCGTRFVSLGALCQHFESESCGVLKFRVVQATMDRLLGQMTKSRLTF